MTALLLEDMVMVGVIAWVYVDRMSTAAAAMRLDHAGNIVLPVQDGRNEFRSVVRRRGRLGIRRDFEHDVVALFPS